MIKRSCKVAVKLVKKLGGIPLTREQLEARLGYPLPAVVSACQYCGQPTSEKGFAKIWYILINNAKLEKRATHSPFGGVATTGSVKYTAVARCAYCDSCCPIIREV